MNFDPHLFKAEFPLFSQAENASLIYLDNAATTQTPQCVMDAITHFYCHSNANAQRSSHRLARSATAMVGQARLLAAEFMGVESDGDALGVDHIVFTSGATEALNIIAYGLASLLQNGDEVVLSTGEHHANLLPWQRLVQQHQGRLVFLPNNAVGVPDITRWHDVVSERTKIIALSAASNVLGEVIDFSVIADIKQHYPEVVIVLDASQVAAHIPLKATQWQCDFIVCSAHKFYGPTGVGLLYGKPKYLQQMPPLLLGGEMVEQAMLQDSRFAEGVQRFEAGTSSLAAIAGLQACLLFWQQQDRHAMRCYEQQLTQYLFEQLRLVCQPVNGLRLLTSDELSTNSKPLENKKSHNVGIAVIVDDSSDSASQDAAKRRSDMTDLAHWLDESDIAVRVGRHCAHTLWASLASSARPASGGLRISLAAYNTVDDIDALLSAIRAYLDAFSESVIDTSRSASAESPQVMGVDTVVGMDIVCDDLSNLCFQDLVTASSWQKRFKLLLQWGQVIQPKPAIRQPQYLVEGCESLVWVKHKVISSTISGAISRDRHYFLIDSDANVVKGLAALLLYWCNGKTREEIQAISIDDACASLGLQKYLSESRMNGFLSLVKVVKCV